MLKILKLKHVLSILMSQKKDDDTDRSEAEPSDESTRDDESEDNK